MTTQQPYLEARLVEGEWRLGIVDDEGVWIMLRRDATPSAADQLTSDAIVRASRQGDQPP